MLVEACLSRRSQIEASVRRDSKTSWDEPVYGDRLWSGIWFSAMPSTRNGSRDLNKVSATLVYNIGIAARSFGKEIRRHTGPKSLDVQLEKVDKREEDICASVFCFLL